jgi:hypothetical protein
MSTPRCLQMSRSFWWCALLLAVACSEASVDTTEVAKLVGFPFSEPIVTTKVESKSTGLFGSDVLIHVNFQLGPNDLKALLDSCERYGFKRQKLSNAAIPERARNQLPKEQLAAVCVKEVKEKGLNTLYLYPAGLHYVWSNF